jgi:hypothetical protein
MNKELRSQCLRVVLHLRPIPNKLILILKLISIKYFIYSIIFLNEIMKYKKTIKYLKFSSF